MFPTRLLQVAEPSTSYRFYVVLGTFVVATALGLLIAYKAFQGYRRNRSEPMLFLAAGLILVTVVPPLFSLGLPNVTDLDGWVVVLAMSVSQICGLLSITYSLYGRF